MNAEEAAALILVVEDSEDDTFFLERSLSRTGLDCRRKYLANGGQAVEYLQNLRPELEQPSVIFLDLKMPVMNGFDVLRWIQTHDPGRWDVVVLSGSDQQSDIETARQLGASGYLVKPANRDELVACLAPRLQKWSKDRASSQDLVCEGHVRSQATL